MQWWLWWQGWPSWSTLLPACCCCCVRLGFAKPVAASMACPARRLYSRCMHMHVHMPALNRVELALYVLCVKRLVCCVGSRCCSEICGWLHLVLQGRERVSAACGLRCMKKCWRRPWLLCLGCVEILGAAGPRCGCCDSLCWPVRSAEQHKNKEKTKRGAGLRALPCG